MPYNTHIYAETPMIDLSQFVDKKVRVTLRNGAIVEGYFKFCSIRTSAYPYIISYMNGNKRDVASYTREGRLELSTSTSPGDIIHIKTMKKYEQLESKVAKIQKEIERLKREEENYPKLKPVKIIRTVTYTPEEYFENCEENGKEPTEEGYVYYYMDPVALEDCFTCREYHTQEIKEVDN
jgi:hypothetical protein